MTVRFAAASLPGCSLLDWIEGRAAEGQPVVYWRDSEGRRAAAAGAAFWQSEVSDPVWREAREALQNFWQSADYDGPLARERVRAFNLFAFQPEAGIRSVWRGLPRRLTMVPAEFYWSDSEGTGGVIASNRVILPEARLSSDPVPDRSYDPDGWSRSVNRALAAIETGELRKVVLARRWSLDAHAHPTEIVRRLESNYPGCTVFWVHLFPGVDFIGATPELLVERRGLTIRTVALAGTARRGLTPAEDARLGAGLLADPKERHEHEFVVKDLQRSLRMFSHRIVSPAEPELLRLANVQHLRTPLLATLRRPADVSEIAEAFHPTPAIGGVAGTDALDWISRHEPEDRGWFGGALGWNRPDGQGVFHVSLRSGLVRDGTAHLFAGCGIVKGSDPAREWDETRRKLSAIAQALGAPEEALCAA